MRKRKELELQILTESIRLWEGEDIKTFGSVIYMSQAMVQNPGCEVRRYSVEHFLKDGSHFCSCIGHSVSMHYFIQAFRSTNLFGQVTFLICSITTLINYTVSIKPFVCVCYAISILVIVFYTVTTLTTGCQSVCALQHPTLSS